MKTLDNLIDKVNNLKKTINNKPNKKERLGNLKGANFAVENETKPNETTNVVPMKETEGT